MKKYILTFLLLLVSLSTPSAYRAVCFIQQLEPINYYDSLIKAVVQVESESGKYLYNPKENSVGWFHIRQIRVNDYNQRTGSHFTLEEMYDYDKARKVFLYYTKGQSFERVARKWNGWTMKPSTLIYWNRVKSLL